MRRAFSTFLLGSWWGGGGNWGFIKRSLLGSLKDCNSWPFLPWVHLFWALKQKVELCTRGLVQTLKKKETFSLPLGMKPSLLYPEEVRFESGRRKVTKWTQRYTSCLGVEGECHMIEKLSKYQKPQGGEEEQKYRKKIYQNICAEFVWCHLNSSWGKKWGRQNYRLPHLSRLLF